MVKYIETPSGEFFVRVQIENVDAFSDHGPFRSMADAKAWVDGQIRVLTRRIKRHKEDHRRHIEKAKKILAEVHERADDHK